MRQNERPSAGKEEEKNEVVVVVVSDHGSDAIFRGGKGRGEEIRGVFQKLRLFQGMSDRDPKPEPRTLGFRLTKKESGSRSLAVLKEPCLRCGSSAEC